MNKIIRTIRLKLSKLIAPAEPKKKTTLVKGPRSLTTPTPDEPTLQIRKATGRPFKAIRIVRKAS